MVRSLGVWPTVMGGFVILAMCAAAPLTLAGPHEVSEPRGSIHTDWKRAWKNQLEREPPADVGGLIRLAQVFTNERMWFDLSHRTRLSFGPRARAAHCLEYSHFFARLVQIGSPYLPAGPPIEVRVVRSHAPRVWGWSLPWRGFENHDWVYVTRGRKRWFWDPSLADAGLEGDLRGSVLDWDESVASKEDD